MIKWKNNNTFIIKKVKKMLLDKQIILAVFLFKRF